jgi:hypothetical protein
MWTSPAITHRRRPRGDVHHDEREYLVGQVEIPASKAADLRKLESAIVADGRG